MKLREINKIYYETPPKVLTKADLLNGKKYLCTISADLTIGDRFGEHTVIKQMLDYAGKEIALIWNGRYFRGLTFGWEFDWITSIKEVDQ